MCKIFTNSLSTLTFCLLQKNDLSCLNNLFMVSFQHISMSSYAKNKQQMCRVTQHQCNVAKCGKYSQIHPVHWLFVYYKKNLSSLNNLFMVMFQLIWMSSYAKNKLQMCWVTQHQCRSRQMWKIFTNSPSTLTFVQYKNYLLWLEQSIHGSTQDVLLCKEQTTDVLSHSTSV